MNNKKNKAPEGSEEELKLRIYATGIRSENILLVLVIKRIVRLKVL